MATFWGQRLVVLGPFPYVQGTEMFSQVLCIPLLQLDAGMLRTTPEPILHPEGWPYPTSRCVCSCGAPQKYLSKDMKSGIGSRVFHGKKKALGATFGTAAGRGHCAV